MYRYIHIECRDVICLQMTCLRFTIRWKLQQVEHVYIHMCIYLLIYMHIYQCIYIDTFLYRYIHIECRDVICLQMTCLRFTIRWKLQQVEHVCIHICVYIFIYIHINKCMYIDTFLYRYIPIECKGVICLKTRFRFTIRWKLQRLENRYFYTFIYIHIYMYLYIYIYIDTYLREGKGGSTTPQTTDCACVCVYVGVCVCMWMYMCVCVYLCLCIFVCVCVYAGAHMNATLTQQHQR